MEISFFKKYFAKFLIFGLVLFGGMMFVGIGNAKAEMKCDFDFYVVDISPGSKFLLTNLLGSDCKNSYSGNWKLGSGTVLGTCSGIKGMICIKDSKSECETIYKKTIASSNNFTDGKEAKTVISSISCVKYVATKQTNPVPVGTKVNTDSATKIAAKVPGQLGSKGTLGALIPDCSELPAKCRDISIFVVALIGITRYLFSIVGALFLLMFIYGGIIWITSQGNPEKLKKGFDTFVSAVIGLVIVFSAYMLVNYLGTALDLQDKFKI